MSEPTGKAAAITELGGLTPPPRQGALALGVPDVADGEITRMGRPPGARNRRTEEFRRELGELGALPGRRMAELIGRWFVDFGATLSRELHMDRKDVAVMVAGFMRELLPYAEQKLPIAIDVEGKGAMVFALVDPSRLIGGDADEGGPLQVLTNGGNPPVAAPADAAVGQSAVGQNGESDDVSKG